tara:strand:+ start:11 stop:760 length:750 start_codon:yes stop_codon:yes gene_type:complete
MRVLDLFSGIGGFSLGLERAGMETVAFCEYDEKCRQVLTKHWPDVPQYNDVRTLTGEQLEQDGITVDIICGGFPCQDISVAGERAGIQEGTRSGLWSHCARLLGEVRPEFAIFENVTNLLNGERGDWFKRVLWDISQVGYDAEWHCIPASEFGAHHHRDRIWITAYPKCAGRERLIAHYWLSGGAETPHTISSDGVTASRLRLDIDSKCLRAEHGVPVKPYRYRLKQCGNAVYPPITEMIGRAIMESSK